MISLENDRFLTPLQKLPKNVGDLGKLIVAKGFKKLPKSNKSPNLVTLAASDPAPRFNKRFDRIFLLHYFAKSFKEVSLSLSLSLVMH